MDLELVGLGEVRLSQPLANVLPLVALELKNFAVFRVLDNGSVARKFLLARPDDLLQIILRRKALDRGEGFAAVSLLDPYVDEAILDAFFRALDCISKRVEGVQVLDGHATFCVFPVEKKISAAQN